MKPDKTPLNYPVSILLQQGVADLARNTHFTDKTKIQ
jgi:hypothetical protein